MRKSAEATTIAMVTKVMATSTRRATSCLEGSRRTFAARLYDVCRARGARAARREGCAATLPSGMFKRWRVSLDVQVAITALLLGIGNGMLHWQSVDRSWL